MNKTQYIQYPLNCYEDLDQSTHVIQSNGLPKQLFIERQRETTINIMSMKHSHSHYSFNKVEV